MTNQIALDFIDVTSPERDAFDSGALYLLISEGRYSPNWSGHVGAGQHAKSSGAPCRTIHVMSRPAGGEIRGYISIDGSPLYLRTPASPLEWNALDLEVSRRLGLPVVVDRTSS